MGCLTPPTNRCQGSLYRVVVERGWSGEPKTLGGSYKTEPTRFPKVWRMMTFWAMVRALRLHM